MSKQDGGPAFPVQTLIENYGNGNYGISNACGMTLRDYFAGQALAGLAHQQYTTDFTANLAYALADAMLEESVYPPCRDK